MSLEFLLRHLARHALSSQPLGALQNLGPFDITAAFRDWSWELIQLEEGDPRPGGTVLRLDPLLVGKVKFDRAVLHRLRGPPQGWTLIVRGSESSSIFVAGHLLRPAECLVLDGGTEIELLCHGAGTVIALSLCGPAAAGLSALASGKPLPLPGRAYLMSGGANTLGCIPDCINQTESAVTSHAAPYPAHTITGARIRQLLICLLEAMADVVPRDADRRRTVRRRTAVERARGYIREHLTEPIRLVDLCQYAYVQQRSLEYGFREIVGLSPMAYIKMLRLGEVHRRLLTDSPAPTSISQVALDSGFHHLGQFASDYKRLFLENPSTTRKRVRFQSSDYEPHMGRTRVYTVDTKSRHEPAVQVIRRRQLRPVAPGPRAPRDSCTATGPD